MRNQDNIIFFETQRFNKIFLLLILIPINAINIAGCIVQIGFGKPWGNNPMSDTGLIISMVIILLLTAYMLYFNMKTIVDCDGIHIRIWLFPFYSHSKSFFWEDILEAYIRKYKPILEYGGWGIRLGLNNTGFSLIRIKPMNFGNRLNFRKSSAYNMSGNIGLQLVLANGIRVLIGTNSPEELSETLQKLGKSDEKNHGERKGE